MEDEEFGEQVNMLRHGAQIVNFTFQNWLSFALEFGRMVPRFL